MYQKVSIIGRLGNEVNFKVTQNGMNISQFSVAVSRKNKDGTEEVEWFNCNAFSRMAEIARDYLKKGHLVFCEGELKTTKYTDKDGINRQAIALNVFQIKLLTPREEQKTTQKQETKREATPSNPYGDFAPDELPF